MNKFHMIVIALLVAAAAMTAPDQDVTKLAVLGKVAEVAGEQSGSGLLGQASVAAAMEICVAFDPLVRQDKSRDENNPCRSILRMRDSTRSINLLAFNVAFLNMEGAPRIVCLGAIQNVKCFASGGMAGLKHQGRAETSGSISGPWDYSPNPNDAHEEAKRTAQELRERLEKAKRERSK